MKHIACRHISFRRQNCFAENTWYCSRVSCRYDNKLPVSVETFYQLLQIYCRPGAYLGVKINANLPDLVMPIRLGTIYGNTLRGYGPLFILSWSCVQWFPSVLDPLRKHLTGEQLTTDTKRNQTATCSLQKLHTDSFYYRVKLIVLH
jgi:hypothetical protein